MSRLKDLVIIEFLATYTTPRLMARPENAFGNLKIPRFEALNTTVDADGWREVPPVLQPNDFSSLVGLPIMGIPPDKDALFNIESTYLTATCQPFIRLPYSLNPKQQDWESMSSIMSFNFSSMVAEKLMPGELILNDTRSIRTFFFATDPWVSLKRLQASLGMGEFSASQHDPKLAAPRRLVFGSLFITNDAENKEYLHITNCTVHQTHVKSAAFCPSRTDGSSCRVQKVRLSLTDRRPANVSIIDLPSIANGFSRSLALRSHGTLTGTSFVEGFLPAIPGSWNVLTSTNDTRTTYFIDFAKVPAEQFSQRFSLLLNGVLASALLSNVGAPRPTLALYDNATLPVRDMRIFASAPPPANSSDWRSFERYTDDVGTAILTAVLGGLPFIPAATTARASRHAPIFVCHAGWLAALLVASAALLLTGVAALALQLRCTLAPDMLRYVASMTYANPHFRAPPGGTTLDGVERARLLRNVRVRVGDIRGDDSEVGEVAFVAADDIEVRDLERKRHYA
jgi:hypothetical protein